MIRAMGRGKTIGYPTINLKTDYALIPKNGVYVTEAEVDGPQVGRPHQYRLQSHVRAGAGRSIETFILDFDGDLYDKQVRLHFLERIRDEMKFGSAEELTARIAKDVERGRAFRGEKGRA